MFRKWALMYFVCEFLCSSRYVKGEKEDTEVEMKKKILEGYDPHLPPTLYTNDNYFYFISFRILRIRGLDEKKGEFTVEAQTMMTWTDERLSWESIQVTEIRASTKDIWMPSIYFYNEVEPEEMTLEPLPIIIQKGAFWTPRYTIRTSCIPNLRYYPFDKNVCDVMIASRSKEEDFLSTDRSSRSAFHRGFLHTAYMLDNPQWSHDPPKTHRKKMQIDSDIKRDVIIYSFPIQRSMPLIPLGILTPCLTCSLLLLTTFWMQAGSTLRTGLCVTSMLISSSCLFTLGKMLPANGSSTPIIVEYVSITLILSAVSSIQATITSVFRRSEKLPPISYTTIISKIPSWCLILMGIFPEMISRQQLDQKFLFSELHDQETRNAYGKKDNNVNVEQIGEPRLVQSLWMKYIILLDRLMFYLLGLVILLFVISVIMTE